MYVSGSREVRLGIFTVITDMVLHLLMLLMSENLPIEPDRSTTMI
jgi:hypothetical protein